MSYVLFTDNCIYFSIYQSPFYICRLPFIEISTDLSNIILLYPVFFILFVLLIVFSLLLVVARHFWSEVNIYLVELRLPVEITFLIKLH